MKQQISFGQYRAIDLTILAVLMAACMLLIHFAAGQWFADQLYVVSPVGIVVALVMMRWSGWAAIHALLGGLFYAAISGGQWQHFLIYGIGNLLSLAALVFFCRNGKERVRNNSVLSMAFGLSVQALMLLGRAGVALLLGYSAGSCIRFITTDLLSCLFAAVVMWIVRRVEGLFEDQKHYLLRMERERQDERRDQF